MLISSWIMLGWWLANLSGDLFGLIYPQHYIRVRYEDLTRSTAKELRMLLERLVPVAHGNLNGAIACDNRHQLHGNKVRLRHLSAADVRQDLTWRSEMPAKYSKFLLPIGSVLGLRYGYGKRLSVE